MLKPLKVIKAWLFTEKKYVDTAKVTNQLSVKDLFLRVFASPESRQLTRDMSLAVYNAAVKVNQMNLVKKLTGSVFLRHNAILFIGSMLVGAGNYLYYPILGRMLEPSAYGEVQALVALFVQLTILLAVLGQVTVNIVANYDDEIARQTVLFELEKLAYILTLGIVLLMAVFSWKLKAFFQFESTQPFIFLLIALMASVPAAFRGAYLRAVRAFTQTSIAQIIGAFGKIVFSAGLVALGFRTGGAIVGLIIAQLLSLGYLVYTAKRLGFFRPHDRRYSARPDLKIVMPELKYALLVLVTSGIITLLASIDLFVVKHYFSPQIAGEYGGISTTANIVFFLTGSVAQVMLPSVRIKQSAKENRRYFVRSLMLVAGLGSAALMVFALLPRLVVKTLMGAKYLEFAHLLPRLSIAMFLLSLVNLVICYNLALRRYRIGVIVVLGVLVIYGLMFTRHGSLQTIVNNLIIGNLFTLGLFAISSLIPTRSKGTS